MKGPPAPASTLLAFVSLASLLLLVDNTKVKETPRKFIRSKLSSFRPQPLRMCRQRDVCRTSLKYKDGTIADEGLLCKCSEEDNAMNEAESKKCPSEWTEGDPRTLTWQHYERAHWYVQYRFCSEVFSLEHQCDQGAEAGAGKEGRGDGQARQEEAELAAVVETDLKTWHPHVTLPRCTCPLADSFKMMGWQRESGMWRYFYKCQKPDCQDPSSLSPDAGICAKIYIDTYRKSDMVNEMKFLCNCPKDFLCDAKFDEREHVKESSIFSDHNGKYIVKMCEPVVQKKSNK